MTYGMSYLTFSWPETGSLQTLIAKETKHTAKEKCHKDGQQKSPRPHARLTTLKIRKKKEKGII